MNQIPTNSKRVLCIGDIALDVIVQLEIDGGRDGFSAFRYGSDTPSKVVTRGGGAAANVASWLSSTDVQPELLARIGTDPVGHALITELEEEGVICHLREIPELATGTVVVLVDKSGERTMFPDSGANAGLSVSDLPELEGIQACYVSGYSLFNKISHQGVREIFNKVTEAGIPIIFDPASVGTMSAFADRDEVVKVIPTSDVMILNESEARFLSGIEDAPVEECLQALTHLARIVVIKRNESGAIALDVISGERVSDRKVRHQPVDTTGAGDSFAAGFIDLWLQSGDLFAAIEGGNLMAGRCVQVLGARPPKSR